ncbi:addiction module protein [Frigoriglobus tundricola]|uniref:Addiction module component n=1 Tax=Frigoriglobus tundricola TaxID=2774151 RepID=A0A6M5YPX9_9BACT|nr:addiction module protein [Frigoriglobus tundricola]QJW96099.1 hypothetical protein FTUN_3653 [Frigoriglobus tundricola]
MSTTTTETPEVRDVLDRALKLSVAERELIARRLRDSIDAPPTDADWDYWKAEIKRRIEAVENGTMKTYTLEETMAYLRQVAAEGGRK